MGPVRVAVIGAGYMGTLHAVKLHAMDDGIELVAVVDSRRTRAEEVAHQLGCFAFESVDELMEKMPIDAATVATPTATHYSIATQLLEAGIHCLVEKPLASTSIEALKLVEMAERASLVLLPGHIERFNPAVRAVRERNPDIRYISAYRVGPMSFRSVDTDVVLDVMTHDIDIALFLTGVTAADVVVARAFSAPENINDVAKVELHIGSCIAELVASRLAIARRRKMRIYTTDGYFSIDCYRRTAVKLDRSRYLEGLRELRIYQEMGREVSSEAIFSAVGAEHIEDPRRHGSDSLTEELKHFFGCIAGSEHEPVVHARDGLTVVSIAETILLAMQRHVLPTALSFRKSADPALPESADEPNA